MKSQNTGSTYVRLLLHDMEFFVPVCAELLQIGSGSGHMPSGLDGLGHIALGCCRVGSLCYTEAPGWWGMNE